MPLDRRVALLCTAGSNVYLLKRGHDRYERISPLFLDPKMLWQNQYRVLLLRPRMLRK